jgi:hypothetical protein
MPATLGEASCRWSSLEDLNPYLSLELLSDRVRDSFVANMAASLRRLLDDSAPA